MTQQQLKEILHYNPNTGAFTWKICPRKSIKEGSIAGRLSRYIQIQYKGKKYYAHRLAWLYMYGKLPKNQIDHINRDKTDNRISNLRDVTHFENQQNQERKSICYINYRELTKRWIVTLSRSYNKGNTKYLGSFKEEAKAIKRAAVITNKYGKA